MEKSEGALITYQATDGTTLHGFLHRTRKSNKCAIIHVHGMTADFFSDSLTQYYLKGLENQTYDFFTTNNRGFGRVSKFYRNKEKVYIGTVHEEFKECVYDIDGALRALKKLGYKKFILSGHSTGCQKVTYYQSIKKNSAIKALLLLAPCDDYNVTKKDLGKKFDKAVTIAKRFVKKRERSHFLPAWISQYTAHRFLSVADSKNVEAQLFNYDGKLQLFSKVTTPILALFGTNEQYVAHHSPQEMLLLLAEHTNSVNFEAQLIAGANHSFFGKEKETVSQIKAFLKKAV